MKNKYEHNNDGTTTIIIKRHGIRFNILIDTVDFERANEFTYSWRLRWDKKAKTFFVFGFTGKKPRKTYYLTRWILGLNTDDVREVHHNNHNGRDCRRCNLVITEANKRRRIQRRKDETVGDPNGVDGFVFLPKRRKRKQGGHDVFWARSYVHDVLLGTHIDYSDSLTERRLAMEIVAGNTDERITAQLAVFGHDPAVIQSELTRIRKLYVWPNPS